MNKKENIVDFVLEEIRSARVKPGEPVPSRQDLMKQFACARATVDSAISSLVDKKILSASKGAGTFVAGIKVSKTVGHIAIVSRRIENHTMQQEIAYSLTTQLPNKDSLKFYSYDEVRFPGVWEECKRQRMIVFIMPDIEHGALLLEVQQKGLPHLVLYRDVPESSFVSVDNSSAVNSMVRFLATKGCTKIAYFGLTFGRYHFPERRYIGYLEGLHEAGLKFDKEQAWLLPSQNESQFFDQFRLSKPFPDALIVDEASLGPIIAEVEARGRVVGKDFFLAKIQNVKPGTYSFPIATFASVTEEVGKEASLLLEKIMAEPEKKYQNFKVPEIRFE